MIRGLVPIGKTKREKTHEMKYELYVPDMTCHHCKLSLESSLRTLPGVQEVRVNLEAKMIGVDGEATLEDIKKAIQAAGYTVEERWSTPSSL
jgi:copper chaperone CopZ